jgi:hypothetical protein
MELASRLLIPKKCILKRADVFLDKVSTVRLNTSRSIGIGTEEAICVVSRARHRTVARLALKKEFP